MTEPSPSEKKKLSADWFLRGALTRIGDTIDRFTGRRWIPSSSLATSELAERIKTLLASEAKQVPGKGTVVPHNISLKVQWDKFAADSDEGLQKLEQELLTSTIDHINDSLFYTFAPVTLRVKPDYFTEGVKLNASFDTFSDDEAEAEMNVTVPSIKLDTVPVAVAEPAPVGDVYIARFELKGNRRDKRLEFPAGGRISVGRVVSNELMIDDISVSKIHAALVANPDETLSVADTGSTNGTFINGQRISYGKATKLAVGDKVKFGTVEVIFDHIPRPVVVEVESSEEDAGTDQDDGETVAIEGFEFRSRIATPDQTPSAPIVPVPDDTLDMEPAADGERTSDVEANVDKVNQ